MTSQGHPRLVNALAKMYGKVYSREIDPMNEVREQLNLCVLVYL